MTNASRATSAARQRSCARRRSGSNGLLRPRPNRSEDPRFGCLALGRGAVSIAQGRMRGQLGQQRRVVRPSERIRAHLAGAAVAVEGQRLGPGRRVAGSQGQRIGRIDRRQALQPGVKPPGHVRRAIRQPLRQVLGHLCAGSREARAEDEAGLQREPGLRLQLLHHLQQIGLGPAQAAHPGQPLREAGMHAGHVADRGRNARLRFLNGAAGPQRASKPAGGSPATDPSQAAPCSALAVSARAAALTTTQPLSGRRHNSVPAGTPAPSSVSARRSAASAGAASTVQAKGVAMPGNRSRAKSLVQMIRPAAASVCVKDVAKSDLLSGCDADHQQVEDSQSAAPPTDRVFRFHTNAPVAGGRGRPRPQPGYPDRDLC